MTSPLPLALKVPAVGRAVTVRVPGTSANLGPGFDSLGLAVSLYDTLTVCTLPEILPEMDDGGGEVSAPLEFELSGEGVAELPRDASHLVVKAMDLAFARLGYRRGGLKIIAENVLPHGRGLGSSASAIVAAVFAANALVDADSQQGRAWVLQLASEMEGHPDNVAPAVYGAVAISWSDGAEYSSSKVTPSSAVIPVVAIPDFEVKTERARGLLPATVPHGEAAANAGRAALLVHALTNAPELLLPGTRDYLHQDYRAEAMPESAALVRELRSAGHAAFISGAGPTVMTLANGDTEATEVLQFFAQRQAREEEHGNTGVSWRVRLLEIDYEGAKVEVHPGS